MTLAQQIITVKENLRAGRFTNEAAVSQGIILPVLSALGWPVFDVHTVIPEYSVGTRRVDYALCHPADRSIVFLEIKRVGQTEGADRQLFEYAFFEGVPMGVVTDGQEWSFYLPGEQGQFHERRVYKLDLLERDDSEIVNRLQRYLSHKRIVSGEALEAARADYRNAAKARDVTTTIPLAWKSLLEEPDGLLIELLAEKVEDLCGYSPELDQCAEFIERFRETINEPKLLSPNPPEPTSPQRKRRQTSKSGEIGFIYNDIQYSAKSAREVMSEIFRLFHQNDNSFLERFASRKHGKKRRYLAQNRSELYPGRPDLAEEHSIEVISGWWLGTNYSKRDIEKIITLACEVVSIKLGRELKIQLG